jgi:hypothetical protein
VVTSTVCVLVAVGAACSSTADPDGRPRLVRVRDCGGPASSLPPALAAELPTPGAIQTDDARRAEAARRVPGGFAGAVYEDGKPVLLLTDPGQAAAAKAALEPLLPEFDVAGADVRGVRWNFAQLYDWYRYLNTTVGQDPALTAVDIDEQRNRLVYGAADEAARDHIVARLTQLELPCDLALVEIIEGDRDLPAP